MGSGSAEGSGAALPPALLPQGAGGAPEQAWEAQAVATSGSLTRGGTTANFARARALADAAVANAEGSQRQPAAGKLALAFAAVVRRRHLLGGYLLRLPFLLLLLWPRSLQSRR